MKESKSNNAVVDPQESSPVFSENEVLARAVSEDPLFRFLKVYWRQVAVVALAAIAGYLGNQFFQQSYSESMRRSGDLLSGVQKQISVLDAQRRELGLAEKGVATTTADAKKTAEEKDAAIKKVTELKDKVQQGSDRLKEMLLALSDSRKPYDSIAQIYQGMIAAQAGDMEAVRGSLSAFNWESAEPQGQERFLAEAASLAKAGALLDSDATYTEARSILKSLAEKGAYLNIASAIRLGRISLSPDERSEAVSVLESLMGRFPEQATLLDAELARLKN